MGRQPRGAPDTTARPEDATEAARCNPVLVFDRPVAHPATPSREAAPIRHLRTLGYIVEIARHGSIRRTAEALHITPSALTRKVQEFEQELGTAVFERVTQGMRLTSAGELLVRHARDQAADLERVRSQIADLSGVRRGHVRVACSQAFVDNVVPDEIDRYRRQHPLVSFEVQARDHSHAVAALIEHRADVALILQPPPMPELQAMFSCQQPLCALMGAGHPLAQPGPVRLRDCLRFPVAMPDRALAIRHLLDGAVVRSALPVDLAIESGSLEFLRNYVRREHVVTFQIASGIPGGDRGLHAREIDGRDLRPAQVVLGHLRGRALPVATAKFADQVANSLHERFGATA